MLISLHIPKTAGTSFQHVLREHFRENLILDYKDQPLNTSGFRRQAAAVLASLSGVGLRQSGQENICIHGHFLPLKYRSMWQRRGALLVTWMRDPVERLASHYYYWVRTYDSATAGSLHRRVVEEGWSLEDFCFSKELRNTMSKFMWGVRLDRFRFVGLVEHYEEDLEWFCKDVLNSPDLMGRINGLELNVNKSRGRGRYIADELLRSKIAAFHSRDMNLYNIANAMRQVRYLGS